MKLRENRVLGIALGSLLLIGGANIAVYAANGKPLILGQSNSATKTTTVANNKGTALTLKSKASSPPLAVNSKKAVKNLNADLLDGKSAADFASAELVWKPIPFDAGGAWQPCTAYEYEVPQYAVQGDVVHLRGGACDGFSTIVALPQEAQPSRSFPDVDPGDAVAVPLIATSSLGPIIISIGDRGEITVGGGSGIPEFISFEGISFTR